MPNNDSFYNAAREGLETDDTISDLIDDLDAAIESYLAWCDKEKRLPRSYIRKEIRYGHERAEALVNNLHAWRLPTES